MDHAEQLLATKRDFLVPCVYHFYQRPPVLVRGEGVYLFDSEGRRYLDCYCGVTVVSAGHSNPEILDAAIEQLRQLQHTTTIYLTEPMLDLARAIAELAPSPLRRSFFCASGSEANEGALLLAALATGRQECVYLREGLHGRTKWAMSVTGLDMWRTDPNPLLTAHGVPGPRHPDSLPAIERLLQSETIAAVIAEPIQGNGGIVVPPDPYWPQLRRLCDRYGTLLIADEIQTAWNRTGRWFATQHWGVVPDIVTVAKALGNGFPIAAYLTSDAVAAHYTRPGAATFGGSLVSCRAALATLRFHQRHELGQRSERSAGADHLGSCGLPARLAGQSPAAARGTPAGERSGRELLPRGVWRLGLLLLVTGIGLQISLWRGGFSEAAGRMLLAPTLALLLIGSVLALPLVVDPLLRLAHFLPLGLEGKLALQQLARHRGRTCLTSGVLFLALVVAIAFGQSLQTMLRDLRHWYRQTIVADFLVRGAMPDTSFLLAPALPESLGEEIGRCEAVAAVDRIAFVPAEVGDQPVLVLARTFEAGRPLPLDLREGDEPAVRRGLLAGEAVLGTGLAQRLGLHRGQVLKLTTAQGVREVRIAGTAVEYASGGLALYLEWTTAQKLLDVPGVHVFLVSAGTGDAPALAKTLRGFCERHHLLLQSNADLRALIDAMLSRVAGVLWGLIALAFAVASLGIVNTLTMNVHDQTREFGVLRALGLKRGQVGKVVLTQAAILAGISLLPGALSGVGLAYTIHRSSAAWAGPQTVFRIDGVLVLGVCVLAVLMALLAAAAPSRRAVQLSVARTLHDS